MALQKSPPRTVLDCGTTEESTQNRVWIVALWDCGIVANVLRGAERGEKWPQRTVTQDRVGSWHSILRGAERGEKKSGMADKVAAPPRSGEVSGTCFLLQAGTTCQRNTTVTNASALGTSGVFITFFGLQARKQAFPKYELCRPTLSSFDAS